MNQQIGYIIEPHEMDKLIGIQKKLDNEMLMLTPDARQRLADNLNQILFSVVQQPLFPGDSV